MKRTLGRWLLHTRCVEAEDGERLDLAQVAGREAFVLFYVVTLPWWLSLIVQRHWYAWWLQADPGTHGKGSIPQDEATGTAVSTLDEVDRIRARAARRAAAPAIPPAPVAQQPPSWSPPPAQAATPMQAAPQAQSSPPADGQHAAPPSTQPAPAMAAASGNAPRLSAAPFIPAGPDPDVIAAQQLQRSGGQAGGVAVHLMEKPELTRRAFAATVDWMAILAVALLLISAMPERQAGAVVGGPMMLRGLFSIISLGEIAVVVGAWFVFRPLAIAAFGQTLGHRLFGYRIYAARGARVGLGKALLREGFGWGALGVISWTRGGGWNTLAMTREIHMADLYEDPASAQSRLSHDRMADTWPVRD